MGGIRPESMSLKKLSGFKVAENGFELREPVTRTRLFLRTRQQEDFRQWILAMAEAFAESSHTFSGSPGKSPQRWKNRSGEVEQSQPQTLQSSPWMDHMDPSSPSR